MTTFAFTSGDPAHLAAAQNASMADIQGPLIDIRTFLNGNISDINLSSSAAITEAKLATSSAGLAKGAFSAHRSTNMTSATGGTVVFDTEDFDLSGWHDTTNGRYTPQVPGVYRLTTCLSFNSGLAAGADIEATINKNGAFVANMGAMQVSTAARGPLVNGTCLVQANGTTDYFTIGWASNSTVQIIGSSGTFYCGELVGRS